MPIKSTKLLFILSFSLMFVNCITIALSQTSVKLEFNFIQKKVKKETQKVLQKYDLSFIVSNEEVKSTYTKDNILNFENISKQQLEQIKKQGFVLVKFSNKKKCFYFIFSSDFLMDNKINNFLIYRITKNKRIFKLFLIKYKTNDLASTINYNLNGKSLSRAIGLIPCIEYKGEFDKGIDAYINSLN